MTPFECDFLELDARLGKGPPLPVYVVCGEEPFLRDRAVGGIVRSLSSGDDSGYSRVAFDGGDEPAPSMSAIVADVLTPSLFGGPKIAVVKRADSVLDDGGDALEEYVESQAGGAHIVLEAGKFDRRRKAAKAVKSAGGIVNCRKLYDQPPPWSTAERWDNDVARWTAKEAQAAGLSMTRQMVQRLIDRVGPGLRSLFEELEKLSIYLRASAGSPVEVTESAMDAVVGEYNEYGVFKLADSVVRGDFAEALRISSALFSQGVSRPGEAGMVQDEGAIAVILTDRIFARVREILEAKSVLDAGLGVDGLVEKLKKNRVFAPQLASEAGRHEVPRLAGSLRALVAADFALKTGQGRPRTVFETLLAEIMRPDD